MTYKLQHNLEIEFFNTFNEVKTSFRRLVDELTNIPDCEAWNSENMGDNDELNEDLCCGICSMCSTVFENDETEIDNDHNLIFHFQNDHHRIRENRSANSYRGGSMLARCRPARTRASRCCCTAGSG